MVLNRRKLPLGIQDFEDLRTNDYVYVDKTEHIYNLVHFGKPYFLSRPRRFGKSLFLSTLKYYFLGKKELFKGLAIEKLEKDSPEAWQKYPVLYFDFNGQNYQEKGALESSISAVLKNYEQEYGISSAEDTLSNRFEVVIKTAYEKTCKKVVVLIDEYDKPLLEAMNTNLELEESNRAVFKGFFGKLKSLDGYLKFVFFTGVTKFSKVSIFSDINQLTDISIDESFTDICGITQAELEKYFSPEIDTMAQKNEISREECLKKLKQMYDGYHFYKKCEDIYNPYSLINAFYKNDFGNFWFETGTPTFLIRRLENSGVDYRDLSGVLEASEEDLKDYRPENPNPLPLFYQSGYLTIKGWNKELRSYTLGYPNDEIKYGILRALSKYYIPIDNTKAWSFVGNFLKDVREGNVDGIMNRFVSIYASLPYPSGANDPESEKWIERDFQNVFYLEFMNLGQFVQTEVHSALGRADCILQTTDYVYIFEFKRDKSADEALAQIDEKGYSASFAADGRKILKIGVCFDSKKRTISDWKVE